MNICYYTISINNIKNKANYSYKYKTQIYTLIRVIIPKYTYIHESSYTIMEFL